MLPRVLLATDIDFWNIGLGSHARVLNLLRYLAGKVDLKVVYLGAAQPAPPGLLARVGLAGKVEHLYGPNEQPGREKTLRRYADFIKSKHFDALIVEYIWLHYLLDATPAGTKTFLDTHDIMSARSESFASNGRQNNVVVDRNTEMAIFERFDHVLMIQEEEFREVRLALGPAKPILAPHPVEAVPRSLASRVKTIGFFASASPMNGDALCWFAREVWPGLARPGLGLSVWGSFCLAPPPLPGEFRMMGPVGRVSQAYQGMDLAINPVLYGAGLKIKNVEALGFGLPLVTTSVGAAGLSDGANWAFAVADTPEEWLAALNRLIDDAGYRRELADGAVKFARERFTEEACFGGLLRALGAVVE